MADAYSYLLLVELEENNVQKLKNKLVKYFQSKKSNGGDCEVDYVSGSRTAVLRFRREEDQKNVLGKERHQISLDQGVLKMTVRLMTDETAQRAPPVKVSKKPADVTNTVSSTDQCTPAVEVQTEAKGRDDETADEDLSSTSAVLGNIPETLSQEFLEMMVENILRDQDTPSASQGFTLETIPGSSSAVVTFQSGKENDHFVTRCPQNRMFTKKGLSVKHLEVTEQVVVEDIKGLSEDLLQLYFEGAGGDVDNVVLDEVEHSAIITFKDHKAAHKIMKKKTHHIREKEIRVYPFYKSLGTALYGKDKPSLKPPAAISEPIDSALWRYLNGNQAAAETIHSHLAKHFCKVSIDQSTVCLSPVASLLEQADAKALIRDWRETVKSALAQALSKFRSLKLQPESEMWEESEEKIRQTILNEDVVLVPDKVGGALSVVGLAADVNRLENTLREVLNKILKKLQREKSIVTQEMKVSPSIFHILCQDGLQDKLLPLYPELTIGIRKESLDLMLTGLSQEILGAGKVLLDAIAALKRQNLEIDKFVLDFLKDEQQEELTDALFTSHGINAVIEINAHGVQLIAVSDRLLNDAKHHLEKLLISQYTDVEDSNVLKKPEWQHLVNQLENVNNKSCRRIQIHTTNKQVVVSGHKDSVMRSSSDLSEFLTQNAHVEETVVVSPNAIVEYIKKHGTSQLKQVADKVAVSFREEAICLHGSRVDVADCKSLVENFVSSVVFESLNISVPGGKKSFQDKESTYVPLIWNETCCVVQLVDETTSVQKVPKPVYQLETPDGVEIAVCKADLCSYPMQAVVSSSDKQLELKDGLSKALRNAAGTQLQDECHRIINLRGTLKPGDCVMTGAGGKLSCKKIIHAVGPESDPAKSQKALAHLRRAVKGSLELAEKVGCTSVALPAISRNRSTSLSLCADTIVKAVKEYCDDKYGDNTLKRIHFVNNDDGAVQAMEAAVRRGFGNHGVSHSQQTLPTKATKTPTTAGSAGSPLDPDCLGQVQTKEGLSITLIKGNIEEATTEVTVNTVFEDLALNKGAVSNAILGAAGPKLQQLVKAKKASGNVGEIIVTEACKLKSHQVFHAVTPHWDNGKGEKTLTGIFGDCLRKAEETALSSISFPAIGTGKLGFPKDFVGSVMLNEIVAFSSKKQPKYLKKVMIVLYPGDAQTIQIFSDEFKKKFPKASLPAPTSSPSGAFSKTVSSTGTHETKMGSVTIQVVTGDITKETTDVIVNSSNETFSLKSGVSKAILDTAGQAVEAECQDLGGKPNPGMIMTQPGNLKCKKILHLVGQTDPVNIQKVVKAALQMCEQNSYTSVSFPAIGTGQGSVQAKQVADAMLDAVIDVLSQNPSSSLQTVRIVIFQPPMLKDFYSSMQQREVSDSKSSLWESLGNIGSKLKSFIIGADKPKKPGDFVIEAEKVDPACFHICGESQAKVGLAKQRIKDLICKDQDSITINDSTILSFSDADLQRFVDMQRTMGVSIRTESKDSQAAVTIVGPKMEVHKAGNEIYEMLRKVRDEEDFKKKVELAATVADWQYQQQGHQFQSFDSKTNFKLEEALKNNLTSVKVKVLGQDYTVTMPSGPATNNQGHTLQIKRIDKLKGEDIPDNWDTMPANTPCHAITLQAGTEEYNEVLNLFQATCKQTVIKIERIQNPALWRSVQIKKLDMENRNGHQNNEKRLFHGTCLDSVEEINNHGFNRSFAGKNAACYGNGTYFAVNASYSAGNTYSRPDPNGEKRMYLCRVLTGDYTTGQQNMVTPPAKGKGLVSTQKYDSVVDQSPNPSMFVIFHDSQAYPEYLITFK